MLDGIFFFCLVYVFFSVIYWQIPYILNSTKKRPLNRGLNIKQF